MKKGYLLGLGIFLIAFFSWVALLFSSNFTLTESNFKNIVKESHQSVLEPYLRPIFEKEFKGPQQLSTAIKGAITSINTKYDQEKAYDKKIFDNYEISLTKESEHGFIKPNAKKLILLTFVLASIGALLMIFSKKSGYEGVWHSAATSRKWVGIIIGTFLISFYIVLYFYPHLFVNWMLVLDPLSKALNGGAASQWFLYGVLYTLCVLVMGVRMLKKHESNNYQRVRTASVMFFQLIFAFLIPETLAKLHLPAVDLKNMWPLDYSFFFNYRLDNLLNSGNFGLFCLVWGIILFVVAVPVLTYFFGKRWYCSWVCGCGGLAETLGDPFRQLSNKSIKAWKIERYLIHIVLVFAVLMTAGVLYTFFTNSYNLLGFIPTESLKSWYGFFIGSVFSGVVGTGFYPLMGNRTWCRFGCPLAAYLGLVQRFKSRFRITTNGGQCISCGNCSSFCEQGIDVRSYAQKGKDIVRSSCVGCGICADVCPRGVLNLENLPEITKNI